MDDRYLDAAGFRYGGTSFPPGCLSAWTMDGTIEMRLSPSFNNKQEVDANRFLFPALLPVAQSLVVN